MHVTILDGGTAADVTGKRLQQVLAAELGAATTATVFALDGAAIASCSGCFGCWNRNPGQCWKDDTGRQVAEQAIRSDLVVFLSPVTFGGYSPALKKAVDRLIPLVSPYHLRVSGVPKPEVVPRKRLPRMLVVGWLDRPDTEAAGLFRRLAERNADAFRTVAAAEVLSSALDEDELRQRIGGILKMMEVMA